MLCGKAYPFTANGLIGAGRDCAKYLPPRHRLSQARGPACTPVLVSASVAHCLGIAFGGRGARIKPSSPIRSQPSWIPPTRQASIRGMVEIAWPS